MTNFPVCYIELIIWQWNERILCYTHVKARY